MKSTSTKKKTGTKKDPKKKPTAKTKATSKAKAKTKSKAKLDKTHIIAILDKSGSMYSVAKAAMDGFNEFLRSQKKVKGKATMDLMLFSYPTDIKYTVEGQDIQTVEELNDKTYQPDGGTALHDAIVKATSNYKVKYDALTPAKRPEKVLVIIITDGQENASKEYPKSAVDQVKALITKRKSENWQFLFLCSTEDTALTGEALGVSKGNTLQFANTDFGNQAMYASVSSATMKFRTSSLRSKSYESMSNNLLAEDEG